jgi:hypothetical protein
MSRRQRLEAHTSQHNAFAMVGKECSAFVLGRDMATEPSLEQFRDYAQVCLRQFTETHPEFKVMKKSDFDFIME